MNRCIQGYDVSFFFCEYLRLLLVTFCFLIAKRGVLNLAVFCV